MFSHHIFTCPTIISLISSIQTYRTKFYSAFQF
uniref:Uncharacterized protein n=1 Tax=Arundo donax TaxID=35708 RepID=A0A0A9FB45_ARUDO